MRFLIDMPVTPDSVSHLQAAGHDAVHAAAIESASGPGIILFRGGTYSDAEMLALIDRVLAQSTRLDLPHSVTVVDRGRIRRRSLPITE